VDKLFLRKVTSLHDLSSKIVMDRAPKFENIALPSMLHEIMRNTHNSWDKNPFPFEHAYSGVVHKITHISLFEVVCEPSPFALLKLLPSPKGIMPKGKVTTIGNFRKHKRIRGHIQPSKGRYCEKLPKKKETQKWQLHTIKFSPNAHTNSFALFQDCHRLTFDPGGHTLTKQEAAIRDQV